MLSKVLFLASISIAIFSMTPSISKAESALEKLPFDIKIGITTNKEIENRGVCSSQIRVSDSYFRCEHYTMANSKFSVKSSANEIVSSILFSTASNNVLPQSWQQLGISLSEKCDDLCSPLSKRLFTKPGTSKDSFISLLHKLNAENIQLTTLENDRFDIKEKVTFVLGPYLYVTTFIKWKARVDGARNENLSEKDLGLIDIEISENY